MAGLKEALDSDRAKKYSFFKYLLWLLETVYVLALLSIFLGSGLSKALAQKLSFMIPVRFLVLPAYLAAVSAGYYLLDLPLNFSRSYLLEHRFSLSRQKISDWFLDRLKAGVLSYLLALVLLSVFYFILKHQEAHWWVVISLFWIFFSLVLAKVAPVWIIPLFFKYKKLEDLRLRDRIMELAGKMNVKILDCFEIDFSKKTLKANAAFVGWGSTRRVILADTLKDKYSYDEIEVILAHEFAHYKMRHLLKLLLMNSFVILLCFFLIFKTSDQTLAFFGLSSLRQLAALPLILIYFTLFGLATQPCENYVSRKMEKSADKMALEATGFKAAFISMMEKLSSQNLSDRDPHPFIKFFFFDHPPVKERIAMARTWG